MGKWKYLLGIFIVFSLMSYGVTKLLEENVIIKVEGKERIGVGNGENVEYKYLVYTEDETFENTDSMWYLKYTSSDLQRELKEDQRYSVLVTGLRVPFLSWHRNIIRINNK